MKGRRQPFWMRAAHEALLRRRPSIGERSAATRDAFEVTRDPLEPGELERILRELGVR